MHFFYELLANYPILSIAQTAFMVWMLVDVYRRGAEHFWFWVIVFVPVLGAWAYFFAVMAPQLTSGKGFSWQRKASLAELRYRAQQSPTLANNLALGQRLIAKECYDEAQPFLEAAHKVEPEHGAVLFALAQCQAGQGRFEQAEALLERIIQRDPRWSDYEAWRLLIDTHLDANRKGTGLEKARALVKIAPSLRHKCILGEILIDQNQHDEARALLDQALNDHAFTPATLRRPNRAWARQAAKLLRRAGV